MTEETNYPRIGSTVEHEKFGTGVVDYINPRPSAKYPIKVHFEDYGCFAFFDVNGMQYTMQEKTLLFRR